jgi:hypothetical protein
MRNELPHVPENVAEQWVHRHFTGSPYAFLPLPQLRFARQTWSLQQLAEVTFGSHWSWSSADTARLDRDRDRGMPLATLMHDAGTWPEPIVLLHNPDGLKDDTGIPMGRFHIVEGHKRLTYLRCLAARGAPRDRHDVWVATIAP